VATGEQASTPISHFRERSTPALSAEGFERRAPLTAVVALHDQRRGEQRLTELSAL
jgi:hypothetical protein